jgi:hypothetical protein
MIMNLYRIGNKVLNLDRVNGIVDVAGPTDPNGTGDGGVLHVLFDQGEIDLTGIEAEIFRRWYRHASRNLNPHKDEDGEDLVSPEDEVRKSIEALVARIDRVRPADSALRHTAHRVRSIVLQFLTGELRPARATDFEAVLKEANSGL